MESYEHLRKIVKGKLRFKEPMKHHTSLQTGGQADVLFIPEDTNDVSRVIEYANKRNIPLHIVGNGTKLLVSDQGIQGIIIKIANTLDDLNVLGERIIAEAGTPLAKTVAIATKLGLCGLEFAAGIPGTVGGAIVMNAGTYLGSMSDVVSNVTAFDSSGLLHVLTNKECGFDYRKSVFQQNNMIVLKAELSLRRGKPEEIRRNIDELMKKRKQSQPLDKPNAGCTFRNPDGVSAGKLIADVGLKGVRIGDAQISKVHANFIINLGNAKANDVLTLIKMAQKRVKGKHELQLIPEIRIIGEW
jgi:UDP-N-acetylmuramate dehydrogenase